MDPNWEYIVGLSMPSPLGAVVCAAGESSVHDLYSFETSEQAS